ncbi:hypothetical protein GCM10023148_34560 [Actinokineospora soli]
MAFEVRTSALRELAGLLDRAREDADLIKAHFGRIRDFAGGEGVLNQVVGGHHAVHQAVDHWLGALAHPTLAAVSQAVAESATYYDHTDAASAEKLDNSYPATDVTRVRERLGAGRLDMPAGYAPFREITEPAAFLAEPKDYTVELDGSPNWWDVMSPMAQIGAALETVTEVAVWLGWLQSPIDPQAEIVKPFVGDWAGVRAAADVMRDVAAAVHAVANNITWASQNTEAVWRGNAGAGAAAYLVELADPVDGFPAPLHTLADAYAEASAEMVVLRDAAVNILNQIGDAAIQAAASAGFAAGAASTGAGTPIALLLGALAGYKVHRVVDGIRSLMEVIGKLDALTSVLKASQTEFGDLRNGVRLPALPDRTVTLPK